MGVGRHSTPLGHGAHMHLTVYVAPYKPVLGRNSSQIMGAEMHPCAFDKVMGLAWRSSITTVFTKLRLVIVPVTAH